MSDISSIKVPEVETPYAVKDSNAVHLSGSNVAAADFMLNLQNNVGGAIKWPSGDMTDLKRGWTAADGFTGAGVGADIPSIAAMIDAKMSTASPVDVVENGNMNAVTSNAVFDALSEIGSLVQRRYTKVIAAGDTNRELILGQFNLPAGTWLLINFLDTNRDDKTLTYNNTIRTHNGSGMTTRGFSMGGGGFVSVMPFTLTDTTTFDSETWVGEAFVGITMYATVYAIKLK